MLTLLKIARAAAPVLRVLGVDLDKSQLDETLKISERLLEVATSFNATFAARGWVATDALNVEEAKRALDLARNQKFQEADEVLAESYSADIIRIHLRAMARLTCFTHRLELAELALLDYEQGRFHASVPVTLAMIDGTGKDLLGAGVFRKSVQLKAEESFLEIGPGMATLLRAMSASRMRTNTAQITLPFRHGIMHGADLGYANRVVAAKAWATLLALGHYAKDYLQPPPESEPGLLEVLRQSARTNAELDNMQTEMRAWTARSAPELKRVIASQQFEPGTPEHAVAQVFSAWRKRQWGLIAKRSLDAYKEGAKIKFLAGKLARNLGPGPTEFRLTAIEENYGAGWVTVQLSRATESQELRLRVLRVGQDGSWPTLSTSNRSWVLHNLWPLESIFWSVAREDEPPE